MVSVLAVPIDLSRVSLLPGGPNCWFQPIICLGYLLVDKDKPPVIKPETLLYKNFQTSPLLIETLQ